MRTISARRRRRGPTPALCARIALYALALAVGAVALQWLDYMRMVRRAPADFYLVLVAGGFLALGIFVGIRLIAPPRPNFDGNPAVQASLGISSRELAVLHALAAGQSNKEIARDLNVSPNTVKTHVARLFEKLEARRRTDAIAKARDLGLVR